VESLVADVRAGKGTVGKLLNDDGLHGEVREITGNLRRVTEDARASSENVRRLTEDARGALADFRTKEGGSGGLLADLTRTLASASEAASDLAESTESMKRSFLFRGLFKDRGYFDLDALTASSRWVRGKSRTTGTGILGKQTGWFSRSSTMKESSRDRGPEESTDRRRFPREPRRSAGVPGAGRSPRASAPAHLAPARLGPARRHRSPLRPARTPSSLAWSRRHPFAPSDEDGDRQLPGGKSVSQGEASRIFKSGSSFELRGRPLCPRPTLYRR
jgi:hypothetical protein